MLDSASSSVLVTGGAGFIGSHLVDRLIAAGARRVHVVDDLSLGTAANLDRALGGERVTFSQADCADLPRLIDLAGEPFDYCFHLAVIPLPHSLIEPARNVERNIAMTTAVCELGRAGGYRRLVNFSSSEVYGTARAPAMAEDHTLGAHTPYAASKAASDLVVASYTTTFGLNSVTVRPFNTYGERQNVGAYAGLIPAVVRAVLTDEPVEVHGDGRQTRDMTYVLDTVAGAIAAAESEAVGASYNLGTGSDTTVNEIVRLLLRALGRPNHPVRHTPPRPGDVRRLVADTTNARRSLGFTPKTPLFAGLKRTVDWYLASGRVPQLQEAIS